MYVSRDPFARQELHKERVKGASECLWCGPKPCVYAWRLESDGGRTFPIRGLFCSKSCMKSYHGG